MLLPVLRCYVFTFYVSAGRVRVGIMKTKIHHKGEL